MRTVFEYLKSKSIIGGIAMTIFIQVVFISIFMAGFKPALNNVSELTVAIINEDPQYGMEMVEKLEGQLPFKTVSDLPFGQAKKELDERKIHMIVHIPADFTQKLMQQNEQVQLDFYINQSNPQMTSTTMQTVATQFSDGIKNQLGMETMKGILQGLNLPEEQAGQQAENVANKVKSNIINSNTPPTGMHNMMAPMFLTLASYVGAMIFTMIAAAQLKQMKTKFGKWRSFWAMQVGNALVSLIVPIVGVSIYFLFQGYETDVFVSMWLSHALEMFVAMGVTGLFAMLLGQAGAFINMPLMLIQTVCSGSVMPQDMMPALYKFISSISVMYYSVQSDYSHLFGGGNAAESMGMMAIIGAGTILISMVINGFQSTKSNNGKQEVELAA
ncbi:YhgE/Pip domain-containing protein [Cohnella sp. WQ 127256]|uniref:YhgE/Pip domain-containing protein n=1 Tax=Cohnella sp. WQ 127256 TaxID=2938790 RepID=UPI0021178A8C|nr:ABC transporter permease [Cohnella sp. WQ 127256]